eukprot:363637-Chlamydomonas_euryale.AAC.13
MPPAGLPVDAALRGARSPDPGRPEDPSLARCALMPSTAAKHACDRTPGGPQAIGVLVARLTCLPRRRPPAFCMCASPALGVPTIASANL